MNDFPPLSGSLEQASTNVKIITIPTTNEINDFGSLRAIKVVLVWKERFNTAGVLKNYL